MSALYVQSIDIILKLAVLLSLSLPRTLILIPCVFSVLTLPHTYIFKPQVFPFQFGMQPQARWLPYEDLVLMIFIWNTNQFHVADVDRTTQIVLSLGSQIEEFIKIDTLFYTDFLAASLDLTCISQQTISLILAISGAVLSIKLCHMSLSGILSSSKQFNFAMPCESNACCLQRVYLNILHMWVHLPCWDSVQVYLL